MKPVQESGPGEIEGPPSPSPLAYIITLNWNRRDDTLRCLASCKGLSYPNLRILVVDNGSADDSVAAIGARFPDVEQIENGRNLGFAAGMNVGMRHALDQGAEFLFLINNDTILAPDVLDLLVEAARASGAGVAAPKILYADEPGRIWSVGGWHNRLTLEVTGCRRGQDVAVLGSRAFDVDFVTACGMLVTRHCIEQVGLFDERFFMYYEDADYCLRARQAGCRLIVVPRATMWHAVSASSGGSDSPNERYHMALSSARFFRKHARGWRRLVVVPYRLGSGVKTVVRLLASGQRPSARAYLRGLRHGLSPAIPAELPRPEGPSR
jgi:GT2 family glycosyltransferase